MFFGKMFKMRVLNLDLVDVSDEETDIDVDMRIFFIVLFSQ